MTRKQLTCGKLETPEKVIKLLEGWVEYWNCEVYEYMPSKKTTKLVTETEKVIEESR